MTSGEALSQAKKIAAHFLFYIEVENNSGKADSDVKNSIELVISIMDVNNTRVLDKIRLQANASKIPLWRNNIEEVLYHPIAVIAQDLAGVERD